MTSIIDQLKKISAETNATAKAALTAKKTTTTSTARTTTTSTSRSSASSAAPAAQPKIDRSELLQQYGMTEAILSAYPELGTLFNSAVAEGWTPAKFQAKLGNTQFWKSMSDTKRKAIISSYVDPASWGMLWNKTQRHVIQLMGDLGALDTNWDWERINAISGQIIYEGWNDERARSEIGQYIVFGSDNMARGKAGEIQANLNSFAYSMGVQNSDQWMKDSIIAVSRGMKTEQDIKNDITTQAIAAFPQYEKQLRGGNSMADLAQPYMQSMTQILEVPAGSVNMFDPTIRKAMGWKDKSGIAGTQPLWDFQNSLRTDERWKKTQNAQDASMGTAKKVLQDFGIYS